MRYYISALNKNNNQSGKKSYRLLLGVINVAVVIGLIITLAFLGDDALLFAVGALCATMILLSIVLFILQMNKIKIDNK